MFSIGTLVVVEGNYSLAGVIAFMNRADVFQSLQSLYGRARLAIIGLHVPNEEYALLQFKGDRDV